MVAPKYNFYPWYPLFLFSAPHFSLLRTHFSLLRTPFFSSPHPIFLFSAPHFSLLRTPFFSSPHPIFLFSAPHFSLLRTPFFSSPHPIFTEKRNPDTKKRKPGRRRENRVPRREIVLWGHRTKGCLKGVTESALTHELLPPNNSHFLEADRVIAPSRMEMPQPRAPNLRNGKSR